MYEVLLAALIVICILLLRDNIKLAHLAKKLKQENATVLSHRKSSEVRTGQIAEQFAPFLKDFGHDPKRAHFLGQPIDYIIFNDDCIIFKEIKSGNSQLSQKQKLIKHLIEQKQIKWEEMRINGPDTDI